MLQILIIRLFIDFNLNRLLMVHKRALLLIEEDEVLVIEEEEGIEVEGAKGVIEQEEEVME